MICNIFIRFFKGIHLFQGYVSLQCTYFKTMQLKTIKMKKMNVVTIFLVFLGRRESVLSDKSFKSLVFEIRYFLKA